MRHLPVFKGGTFFGGHRLFKNCTRQIDFFYIFIQRYTFYLLIFLWADTKLIVNLEFTPWKKTDSFMITRAKLSAVRANSFAVVEQFTTFSQFWCHCLRIGGAALIWGRSLLTFFPICGAFLKAVLIRVNTVIYYNYCKCYAQWMNFKITVPE